MMEGWVERAMIHTWEPGHTGEWQLDNVSKWMDRWMDGWVRGWLGGWVECLGAKAPGGAASASWVNDNEPTGSHMGERWVSGQGMNKKGSWNRPPMCLVPSLQLLPLQVL